MDRDWNRVPKSRKTNDDKITYGKAISLDKRGLERRKNCRLKYLGDVVMSCWHADQQERGKAVLEDTRQH